MGESADLANVMQAEIGQLLLLHVAPEVPTGLSSGVYAGNRSRTKCPSSAST